MNIARSLLAAVLLLAAHGVPAAEDATLVAERGADAWLKVVDGGQYAKSWDAGSRQLRSMVPKGDWVSSLKKVRAPVGKVVSRKVTSRSATYSASGLPAGNYVVVQYVTAFAKKQDVTETVTMMLEKDGRWRAASYFIR